MTDPRQWIIGKVFFFPSYKFSIFMFLVNKSAGYNITFHCFGLDNSKHQCTHVCISNSYTNWLFVETVENVDWNASSRNPLQLLTAYTEPWSAFEKFWKWLWPRRHAAWPVRDQTANPKVCVFSSRSYWKILTILLPKILALNVIW